MDSGTTVKDGIVIEDSDGNQFVWIPVSNVDGDNDATNNNQNEEDLIKVDSDKTVEITLGRYTFDSSGNAALKQNGDNQKKDIPIDNDYNESINTNRTNGGAGAKDLAKFIQSVKDNHGYYIARYEAGKEGKKLVSKSVSVWKVVTQFEASTAAQGMYGIEDEEANYVESDLVNSYAWDTAIVYIQAMDEKNKNYANATSPNSSLENTGKTGDEKCHIFDMAGNVEEWTTEYSTYTDGGGIYPCVIRGDYDGGFYTAYRTYDATEFSYSYVGFRPLLYLK